MKNILKKPLTILMAIAITFGVIYVAPVSAEASGGIILPVVPINSQTQDMNYRTYLSKMTDGAKLVNAYDVICEGIKNAEETINIESCDITTDQLGMIINAIVENAPEFFWFVGGGTTTHTTGGAAVTYTPAYLFTGAALETAKIEFDNAVEAILDTIDSSSKEYEKEKAVHDYLVTHITYDTDASYNQSAYSAIVSGRSVCAGYGKAFLLLTRKLGMKCLYIIGAGSQSTGIENHGWNMIQVDGEYYMVDVTWDDAREAVANDFANPSDIASVSYNYFNMTSANFDVNHVKGVVYDPQSGTMIATNRSYYNWMPATCTATAANYFKINKDRILYVADGAASSISVQDVVKMLTNPIDDACRIYIENPNDAVAVNAKIDSYLYSAYLSMGLSGATSYGNSRITVGHELFYYLLFVPTVTVHGNVNYKNQETKSVTIRIEKANGTEVFNKVVSGPGASYIAYSLPTGNYTLFYQLEGCEEQSRKLSITGTNSLANNILESDIDFTNEIKSISVSTLPAKISYLENKDALNLKDGELTVTYADNSTEIIDLSKTEVTGFDNTKPGNQTLTVTYKGMTTTFDVTITPKSLTSIKVSTLPKKTTYILEEENLDLTDGQLKLTYDNGFVDYIDLSLTSITGFDNTVVGKKTLTVSYQGKETTFTVKVVSGQPIEKIFAGEETQVRSKGASRYDTARVTADNLKKALDADKFDTIIIACGTNFPDALAGSYLAAKKSAPIIIVGGGAGAAGAADAVNYVKDNLVSGGTVYILGGTGAVAQSVEDSLKALKTGSFSLTVSRLKDSDRYGTNMKILAEAGLDGVDTLLICDGAGFADALSASALGLPILLINKKTGTLTQAQKDYISAGGFSKIYILGGTGAVPESIKTDVQGVSTATIKRLSGKGRYETSVAIANEFFATADCITIATGVNFPDGLTGGSLAYALEAPLILTTNTEAAIGLANGFAKDKTVDKVLTFGGTAAIKDETVSSIMAK